MKSSRYKVLPPGIAANFFCKYELGLCAQTNADVRRLVDTSITLFIGTQIRGSLDVIPNAVKDQTNGAY